MHSNERRIRLPLLAFGSVAALAAGFYVGVVLTPAIATDEPPSATTTGASLTDSAPPAYGINDFGQTYGSALEARTNEELPDLVLAVADNGMVGYMRLDDFSGELASSPQEAIAVQSGIEVTPSPVPIYAQDGRTIVGYFTAFSEPEVIYSDE